MSKLWAVIVAEAIGERNSGKVLQMLRRAAISQPISPECHIVPYEAVADGEFMTATTNLQRLPSILLDLRWRLRPLFVRIGVGIGEVSVPMSGPLVELRGQSVVLARRALDELHTESAIPAGSSQAGLHLGSDAALSVQEPKPQPTLPETIALTRFRTVNRDFDDTVNALYRPLDALVLAMSISEREHSCTRVREALNGIEIAKAAAAAPDSKTNPSAEQARADLQSSYWGELMSAAAGIEQLIAERFYAARHVYDE